MPIRLVPRPPGQKKLARYRHTQSCIRVAGFAPGKEREEQLVRCRVMTVIFLLITIGGLIAVFN